MSLLTVLKNLTMTNSRQDTNVNCGHYVDIMELPERGSETRGVEENLEHLFKCVSVSAENDRV